MSEALLGIPFGCAPDGTPVHLYLLDNGQGMKVKIMDLGATVVSLAVPDARGAPGEVTLGYEALDGYLEPANPYFGCVVGRYANRIAQGRFKLDDTVYRLACNNGPHHLHGGEHGFDKKVWRAVAQQSPAGPQLTLRHTSPHGDEHYPGRLDVEVRYTLTQEQALRIDYEARCDRPTVVNLTNHMYFNLAGGGTVQDHVLSIAASRYLPVDQGLIPMGELAPVNGTPMDFRRPRRIGEHLGDPHPQLQRAFGGYDHTWVLDHPPDALALAATLQEPRTGRRMKVFTTEPGLQFYSGNQLDGSIMGRQGRACERHAGLCLEAQHFPDSPNRPEFPSVRLDPGEVYRQTTVYHFGQPGAGRQ